MNFDKRKALQNALSFAQQGKWDKAIAEYQAILRADPTDLTVYNNLGDLYARTGKVPDAIDQYLKLGELCRADGLSVKAIAVYKKIVKLDPTRAEAHLTCADLYEEQGLTGEAKVQLAILAERYTRAGDIPKVVEVYQRLARLDPTNHVLLAKLAELLLREGMREAAAAEYERAAQAAQAVGQTAEGRRLFQKMRELRPDSTESRTTLAEQHLREGRYAEAVDALGKVTSAHAKDPRAWRLLGEAHVGQGQPAEAISALERAVALGLPEAEARRPLALALIQVGRTDEGIALCQKIIDEAVHRNQPDEAIAVWQGVLAAAPDLTPIRMRLAGLLRQLGRHQEARSASLALATAHEASGEAEAAIRVCRELLEQDPSDTEAQARLAVLEGGPESPTEREEPSPPPIGVESAVAERSAAVPEEAVHEEPPALELSLGGVPTMETEPVRHTEGRFGLEAPTGQIFELDESGDLTGLRFSLQGPAGDSRTPLVESEGIRMEFPVGGEEATEAEEGSSGEIAEQLAEADVYLKYGLTEKGRERLLEVLRAAPENLLARRRLKALYHEAGQVAETCQEILAIARILRARGGVEAARAEIREGLGLVPDHAELRAFLVEVSRGQAVRAPVEAGGGEIDWQRETAAGVSLGDGPPSLEEELPPELRVLLEEAPLIEEVGEASLDQVMVEDLAEAEFYLSQGMVEESRAVHRRMHARDPQHPAVARLAEQFESASALAASVPSEAVGTGGGLSGEVLNAQLPTDLLDLAPPGSPEVPATADAHTAELETLVTEPFAGLVREEPALPGDLSAAESLPDGPHGGLDALVAETEAEAPPPDLDAFPAEGSSMFPAPPHFRVWDPGTDTSSEGFINLGAELEAELAIQDRDAAPAVNGPPIPIEDLVREFQKGVRERLDEKDFETHYDLGLAYKEMDLYDEAIQEFRLAGRDPGQSLRCANLLGLCFLDRGEPEEAIRELRAGLAIQGHPREAYHELWYHLGMAFDTQGDWQQAVESFETVLAEDVEFRDVRVRVENLRERLQQGRPEDVPTLPDHTGEPPRRSRDRKIAFI